MRNVLKGLKINKEGLATVDYTDPKVLKEKGIKSLNVHLDFDNLLRLRLALEAASLEISKYHRSQVKANKIGINLFLGDHGRITVTIG